MKLRHPNNDALRRWLGEAETDAELEAHIDTCGRCATTLEGLAADPDPELGRALAEALAGSADLTQRLESGVAARVSSRQVMNMVVDLFGAGFETSRLLLIEGAGTEETDDNH